MNRKLAPVTRRSELSDRFTLFIGGSGDNFEIENRMMFSGEPVYSLDGIAENLHQGIDTVFNKPKHAAARAKMHERLDQIYAAFREERWDDGFALCHGMHEFIEDTTIR